MRFWSWTHIWLFATYINRIVSSFSSGHLILCCTNNTSRFVEIQCRMMKFQIWKFGSSILWCSTHLFISCWPDIIRVIRSSWMSIALRAAINHHCIVIMLPISSDRTSCSLSDLISIILCITYCIFFRCLINRFVPPISRIIYCTLWSFIWILLLNTIVWNVITSMYNRLIQLFINILRIFNHHQIIGFNNRRMNNCSKLLILLIWVVEPAANIPLMLLRRRRLLMARLIRLNLRTVRHIDSSPGILIIIYRIINLILS